MANRRLLSAVSRHLRAPPLSVSVLKHQQNQILRSLSLILQQRCSLNLDCTPAGYQWYNPIQNGGARYCSSRPTDSSNEEEEDGEDEGEEEEEDEDDDVHAPVSKCEVQRGKSEEEKVEEAAEIGYKVIGPLDSSEYPFKPYEPFFAVVQIGSHQFKVSNGDSIFTERLKYCEVNNKLILNRVLMLGSKTQTIIGRPILPEAAVHAVVEEHALDAKVIIFKKKRRKNYRRTKGHRQELTKLRITDIQGIDKSENFASPT